MNQIIMHCMFLGAAGVGKSTLMKRLLSKEVNIEDRTSTQIAEKSIRVVSTAVAKVSDLTWKEIDDTAVACGIMGQMLMEEGNASEVAPNQREGNTQASVKLQKNEPLFAVKGADKQVPKQTVPASKQNTSKQQERMPDDSQPPTQLQQVH